jgi:hypothetical protein
LRLTARALATYRGVALAGEQKPARWHRHGDAEFVETALQTAVERAHHVA